jgi:hypothetical protein
VQRKLFEAAWTYIVIFIKYETALIISYTQRMLAGRQQLPHGCAATLRHGESTVCGDSNCNSFGLTACSTQCSIVRDALTIVSLNWFSFLPLCLSRQYAFHTSSCQECVTPKSVFPLLTAHLAQWLQFLLCLLRISFKHKVEPWCLPSTSKGSVESEREKLRPFSFALQQCHYLVYMLDNGGS